MKRGDIVIVNAPGDYGKPRPAVIIQSDLFNDTHASIIVCLLTSDIQDAPLFRIDVPANKDTGLEAASQIMVDKMVALRREKLANHIGVVDEKVLSRLDDCIALFLDLA